MAEPKLRELAFTAISVVDRCAWLRWRLVALLQAAGAAGKNGEGAGGLYTLVLDKYNVDELYGAVIHSAADCAVDQCLLEGHRSRA